MNDFISWLENWNLGLPEVDRQHAALAERLNAVAAALSGADPGADPMQRLAELVTETRRHFAQEEALMRQHAYPGLRLHHREHVMLVAELHEFIREIEAGRSALTLDTLTPLKRWLIHHVVGSDRDFARYVQRQAQPQPPVPARRSPPRSG